MRAARGFSFIEVIVSIFIVSVMLLLLQAVLQSSILVRTAKDEGVALSIVRNELESLRAGGYAALPPSGPFSNSLLAMLPGATANVVVNDYNETTKQVSTSVTWQEVGGASDTVSLTTLVTRSGGLP